MRLLPENDELANILRYLTQLASSATCKRSKCGSIIVLETTIIGQGYNSMPCNVNEECFKDELAPTFKSDKTCCIHAEQRAIMDALRSNFAHDIHNSTLYFLRLDENDQPKHSGRPYCSICSKMALDVGIKEFVLWHVEGWTAYTTEEYNNITFQYK